jgi:hypothetical protein
MVKTTGPRATRMVPAQTKETKMSDEILNPSLSPTIPPKKTKTVLGMEYTE